MSPLHLHAPHTEIVRIQTLTPMWTGDIEGKSDRTVQIPSLIGSLRWWWEVLLRGVSIDVGEPGDSTHPEDPVNRLFGTTDLRRSFRLNAEMEEFASWKIEKEIAGASNSWRFSSDAIRAKIRAQIVSLKGGQATAAAVAELIHFAARVGTLGARPQMGFGVCSAEGGRPADSLLAKTLLESQRAAKPVSIARDGGLPALHNMFFSEIQPRDQYANTCSELTTFQIKEQIRDAFRNDPFGTDIRHFVCGHIQGNHRVGSKVTVSRPYADPSGGMRIRIYGWFPRELTDNDDALRGMRSKAIQAIFDSINQRHRILWWREMGAPNRDGFVSQGSIHFYLQLARYMKAQKV